MNLKPIFDEELKPYRLEKRLKRIYRPHITLCTNNDLSSAYKIANKEFSTFNRNNQVYMVLQSRYGITKRIYAKRNIEIYILL